MSSSATPRVTVITPVYNGEAYLDECIESVLKQTYSNWDYVIVNNRSTDRTLEIANAWAAREPRIRVSTNAEFVDVIQNHNIAVREVAADSRWCKILQADDWLFPDCLAEMVAVGEAHPRAGIVGSYVLHGQVLRGDGLPYPSPVMSGRDICRLNLLGRVYTFLSPTVLMIRTDVLRSREKYYLEGHLHADVMACYDSLRATDFGFVHKILSFVRRHEQSLTSSQAKRYNLLDLANTEMLIHYGPQFLTPAEFDARLKKQLRRYYDSLAYALYRSGERGKIWEQHAKRMAAAGRPLSAWGVARGLMRGVFTRLAREG